MNIQKKMVIVIAILMLTGAVTAALRDRPELTQRPDYRHPVIQDHGRAVYLPDVAEPPQAGSKVLFDIVADSEPDQAVKGFDRMGIYLNLCALYDVQPDQVKLAAILHGPATKAVLKDEHYRKRTQTDKNPNRELIRQLTQVGVEIYVCGQALAHQEIPTDAVLDEVQIVSAASMVIANKHQQGFAFIPFH